jgi:hypothetical protein
MRRRRIDAVVMCPWFERSVWVISLLAPLTAPPAFSAVLISVDKGAQQMSVSVDGVPRYRFAVSIVPLRSLSSRQKDVGKIGPEPCINSSLILRNRRVKPTQASLANAQGGVPEAADRIARASKRRSNNPSKERPDLSVAPPD